ncbi:MAG: hypothetical protein NWF10_00535 [Candidatus Bathyarchaeota archaeon]|nr:hypothetical protein [Candidatus Bathyarchaeota archaeon]
MKTSHKTLIMIVLFAVSAFTFAIKILMPTTTRIIIPGEDPIIVGEIFRYTQFDVIIISVSTIILTFSSFYLLFAKSINNKNALLIAENHDSSEIDVAFALRLLDGDKRKIFNEIVEAKGEILQSDLHVVTGFSKAKITRTLDYLEIKGLVMRKSYGMTNKIVLNRKKPTYRKKPEEHP